MDKKKGVKLLHSDLTSKIIECFYEVYNNLGLGFSQKIYVKSLYLELANKGLSVVKNHSIEIHYRAEKVGEEQVDLLVENKVILQLFNDKHLDKYKEQQVYNQLRSSAYEVGMILNFGESPEFKRKG